MIDDIIGLAETEEDPRSVAMSVGLSRISSKEIR